MQIRAQRAEYSEIETMRELYRAEAQCQIIHDSTLRRGLADAYLILADGRVAGYGGISNKYYIGRIMEFYTLPAARRFALPMLRELIAFTQATEMEAQTNMPLMLTLLFDCATNIAVESILFEDAVRTDLPCPRGVFARSETAEDIEKGAWRIADGDATIAWGGFLCHYNPPYGDVYMEVAEGARRQGVGAYFVQETKRVCYEAGKKPSARCNPENVASRLTLQKAGFLPCGRLLSGSLSSSGVAS